MSGGSKCSPQSSSACSRAARTSSRPRRSARANGPGIMPVPIIIPRSTSRTPATPSSSTRHASTKAFSVKRSASFGSIAFSVLIEALPRLGAEVTLLDERLHALVNVEAVAVGVAHVARDLHDRVEPAHVGDAERAHRHVHGLGDVLVELGRVDARLVLVAPELARGGG